MEQYSSYIGGRLARNEEVPAALIEHIYQRLPPEQALLIFLRASRAPIAAAHIRTVNQQMEANRQGRDLTEQEKRQEQQREQVQQQRKEERRRILLAEHVVSNAIWLKEHNFGEEFAKVRSEAQEQLRQLAEHDQWWARLYVAEIMGRHFSLRLPEVLDQLSDDENELVRRAAKAAKVARGTAVRPPPKPGEGKRAETLVAPREVESRAVGPTSIEVTWQASVGATSYAVQRRQPDTETEFTTIAPNVSDTSFIDTSLARDTLYEYRVIARRNP